MTANRLKQVAPPDVSQKEAIGDVSRSLNCVGMRLPMKDRENLAKRLLGIDWNIWKLEEYFRTGP
ncbi:MAG: hypothetical protein OK404_02205 [Thaumarchaeota archaeon]|nr:hypothetical protein [Nitrososphaerota archaeon]